MFWVVILQACTIWCIWFGSIFDSIISSERWSRSSHPPDKKMMTRKIFCCHLIWQMKNHLTPNPDYVVYQHFKPPLLSFPNLSLFLRKSTKLSTFTLIYSLCAACMRWFITDAIILAWPTRTFSNTRSRHISIKRLFYMLGLVVHQN